MDIIQALKDRPKAIVIVDDHFSEPDVTTLSAQSLTDFYQHLDGNGEAVARVATFMGASLDLSVEELVKLAEKNAAELWQRYRGDTTTFFDFKPLFGMKEFTHPGESQKLNIIVEFCQKEFGDIPKTFSTLEDAQEAMRDCIIAFIDFNLSPGLSEGEAIASHQKYAELYQSRFEHNSIKWPKIVFLISSKLPGRDKLQAFREATGLRSAFFVPLRKGDLDDRVLRDSFSSWKEKYSAAASLDRYLADMSEAVQLSAKQTINDIGRLELHDLTLVDVLTLSAESESLQSYLTWLLSESLASKIRSADKLQEPLLPREGAFVMLDGKLMPSSVLFDLFADVATSPVVDNAGKPGFGDIYAPHVSQGAVPTKDLLMAISPACDLIRCADDFNVLCVKGEITKADEKMDALLEKKSLFGKGGHVIRFAVHEQSRYAHVQWAYKKGLVTIPVSSLKESGAYKKVARLSEIFAQEVKELALADASRIGIPVDPSFSIAGTALVRMRLAQGQGVDPIDLQYDLKDVDFISAIVSKGRILGKDEPPQETLVFTQQFASWLLNVFFKEAREKAGASLAKVEKVEKFFLDLKQWHIRLKNNKHTECGGQLIFKYDSGDVSAEFPKDLEIVISTQ